MSGTYGKRLASNTKPAVTKFNHKPPQQVLKVQMQLNEKKREDINNDVYKEKSFGSKGTGTKVAKFSRQMELFNERREAEKMRKIQQANRQSNQITHPTQLQKPKETQNTNLRDSFQMENNKKNQKKGIQVISGKPSEYSHNKNNLPEQINNNYGINSTTNQFQEKSQSNKDFHDNKIQQNSFKQAGKGTQSKRLQQINIADTNEKYSENKRQQQHISKQYIKLEEDKTKLQFYKKKLKEDIAQLEQQKQIKINQIDKLQTQITRMKQSYTNQTDKKNHLKMKAQQQFISNRKVPPQRQHLIQELKIALKELNDKNQLLTIRFENLKSEKEKEIQQKNSKIDDLNKKQYQAFVQKEKLQKNRASQHLLHQAKNNKEERQRIKDLQARLLIFERENQVLKKQKNQGYSSGTYPEHSKNNLKMVQKQIQTQKLIKQKETLLMQINDLLNDKKTLNEKLQIYKRKQFSQSESKRQITKLTESIKKKDEEIYNLNNTIKRNETEKNNSINIQNNSLSKKISELTTQINKLKKDREGQSKKYTDEIARLKSEQQTDKIYYDSLATSARRLEQANKQLKTKAQQLNQDIAAYQKQYLDALSQLNSLKKTFTDYKNEQTAMQNSLKLESQKYEKEIKRAKIDREQLTSYKNSNTELFRQNCSLKNNCQSLEQFNKQLEEQNKKIKKELQIAQWGKRKSQKITSQNAILQQSLLKYQQQISNLKTEIGKKDQTIKRLSEQNQAAIKKQIQVAKQLSTYKQNSKREVQDLNHKIQNLETQVKFLKSQKAKQSPSRNQALTSQRALIQQAKSESCMLRQKIEEKERQITRLSDIISSGETMMKELQTNNIRLISDNEMFQKKLNNSEIQKENLQKKYSSEIQSIKKQSADKAQNLSAQIKKLQISLSQKERNVSSIKPTLEPVQLSRIPSDRSSQVLLNEKIKLQKKLKESQNYLQENMQNNQRLQNNYNQLHQQYNRLLEEKNELEKRINQLQLEISQIATKSHNSRQREESHQYIKNFPEKPKLASLQRQLQNFKKQKLMLQQSLQKIQDQLKQVELDNQDLELSNQNIVKQLEKANKQKQSLKEANTHIQKEFNSLKQAYRVLQQQKRNQTRQIPQNNWIASPRGNKSPKSPRSPRRQQLLPQINENTYNYLFHGQLLRGRNEYKLFIKQSIERYMHFRIEDTRILYKFDPLNQVNIHKYIDLKDNLVVIVKLINGYYLAGYAEGFFKPKTVSDKDGIIMSLTNRKCYFLVERNRRSITYDDYFIIFGNSEIRIKTSEKKMFSNFGLSNSYFKSNGDGVDAIMGGSKTEREMEVESYEFHQLIVKV